MARTDIIADSLAMIKNAAQVKREDVLIPYSKVLQRIIEILKEEEYIEGFKEIELGSIKKIKVYLKYEGRKNVITELMKISKSSNRIYVDKQHLPMVKGGFGVAVISTSKGIMTNKEAKEVGIGGEVLCYVW